MKVKEISRTANTAWSPAEQYPIYVAAGTAAQQLDATFSTNAALEIYALDLADPSVDMQLKATLNTEHRFHKLVWGKYGMTDMRPTGVIAGGADNGVIHIYDAAKLLDNAEASIARLEKHTGAVKALDLNPFQANLLATGASESEIYIWDLNNLATPMTPGAKSVPADEISCVAWNRQVQHILASTNPGGRCVVWDLRKNEPIIKVTDHSARLQCKAVAWHPEVATQMALASEDDHSPVVQIWDLRFATSPLKVLEGHQRGILSIAWCPQDPDLLLSCAKDNRILCWNPNSSIQGGEVVYELPTSSQWSFDVQWCPRNPAVIASSSFDGHVTFYSLMGGHKGDQQLQQRQADKIASSFPGTSSFNQQPPQQTQASPKPVVLKKPPKWLRRPVGATFGFGGKLVSFQTSKQQPTNQVYVSQVVTETELVKRSNDLEDTLAKGTFVEFCSAKISQSRDEMESQIWSFLKVSFEQNPGPHFVSLLGFDADEISRKVAVATRDPLGMTNGLPGAVNAEELAERMQDLDAGSMGSEVQLGSGTGSPAVGSKTPSDTLGDSDGAAAFEAIAAGGTLEVENPTDEVTRSISPFTISQKDDTNGLISRAVLTGNFEAAVEMCLHNDRLADAILLAIAGGQQLLVKTQCRYFKKTKCNISRLISSVVMKDLSDIVEWCDLDNWKETLTALVTYASAKEFPALCDTLASRLEAEGSSDLLAEACLCYICSGNVDKLVSCWAKMTHNANTPLQLQDLVEKVMILRKALQLKTGNGTEITSQVLADKLTSYAQMLAAQGSLSSATAYLADSAGQQPKIQELRERLYRAQGVAMVMGSQRVAPTRKPVAQQAGKSPFSRGSITDPFKTTTVSSSQYYTSQVSATAQSSNYSYGQPAQRQQQHQQVASQPAAGDATTTQRHPSGGSIASSSDLHAHLSGPRHYPQYQQGGMQQYYHNEPTQQQQQQQNYPNPSMYNPADYMKTSASPTVPGPAVSQQRVPGLAGYPQRLLPASDSSAQSAGYQLTTSAALKPKAVVGAWNDPPLIKPKEHQNYVAPEPIMAPIMGGAQDTPPHSPGGLASTPPEGMYNPAQVPPQQVYRASQGMYNRQPLQSGGASYAQPPLQNATHSTKPSEPETPKGPIPAEHQHLVETYEGLAQRCLEAGGKNPQIKRKLEDVHKKLNILYDKLREGTLSPMILSGLHEIASGITSYDYQTGLSVHKRLVSSAYFSEISPFMPGLKVLLQVSLQLRI